MSLDLSVLLDTNGKTYIYILLWNKKISRNSFLIHGKNAIKNINQSNCAYKDSFFWYSYQNHLTREIRISQILITQAP